jgi:hypothetical protein
LVFIAIIEISIAMKLLLVPALSEAGRVCCYSANDKNVSCYTSVKVPVSSDAASVKIYFEREFIDLL